MPRQPNGEKEFMSRILVLPNGCWQWTGAPGSNGYGQFSINRRKYGAHKASYLLFVGPISEGKHVHHTCENIMCVNPKHLTVLTPKEHLSFHPNATTINKLKTHCKYGHEFTVENTRYSERGYRTCRICERSRALKSYNKDSEQINASRRKRRQDNADAINSDRRKQRLLNRDAINARQREKYATTIMGKKEKREERNAKARALYAKNSETINATRREQREAKRLSQLIEDA